MKLIIDPATVAFVLSLEAVILTASIVILRAFRNARRYDNALRTIKQYNRENAERSNRNA